MNILATVRIGSGSVRVWPQAPRAPALDRVGLVIVLASPWIAEYGPHAMLLYALTELHDPEAIELFVTEEDAKRALEDCLRDEPDWRGLLRVEEIEFSPASECAN